MSDWHVLPPENWHGLTVYPRYYRNAKDYDMDSAGSTELFKFQMLTDVVIALAGSRSPLLNNLLGFELRAIGKQSTVVYFLEKRTDALPQEVIKEPKYLDQYLALLVLCQKIGIHFSVGESLRHFGGNLVFDGIGEGVTTRSPYAKPFSEYASWAYGPTIQQAITDWEREKSLHEANRGPAPFDLKSRLLSLDPQMSDRLADLVNHERLGTLNVNNLSRALGLAAPPVTKLTPVRRLNITPKNVDKMQAIEKEFEGGNYSEPIMNVLDCVLTWVDSDLTDKQMLLLYHVCSSLYLQKIGNFTAEDGYRYVKVLKMKSTVRQEDVEQYTYLAMKALGGVVP